LACFSHAPIKGEGERKRREKKGLGRRGGSFLLVTPVYCCTIILV
jgi:hypothetical protein